MEEIFSREEIWNARRTLSLDMINTPMPWYPEQAGYAVCEITCGKYLEVICYLCYPNSECTGTQCLLKYSGDSGFYNDG